jgi:hypothetical protein
MITTDNISGALLRSGLLKLLKVETKVMRGGHFQLRQIQGGFESCADILITSYWLHVELGKNI